MEKCLETRMSQLDLDEKDLSDFKKNVPSIKNLYATSLPLRTRSEDIPNSLTTRDCGEALLPSDWIFLPLLNVYNRDQVRSRFCDGR